MPYIWLCYDLGLYSPDARIFFAGLGDRSSHPFAILIIHVAKLIHVIVMGTSTNTTLWFFFISYFGIAGGLIFCQRIIFGIL